jgi:hypothetical protein
MGLVAAFLGWDAVSKMTNSEVERTAEVFHAQMLRNALSDDRLKKQAATSMAGVATTLVRARSARISGGGGGGGGDAISELNEELDRLGDPD